MNQPDRPFAALLGYLLDLWRVARGHPVNPHSLSKLRIINAARIRSGATQMIEVGTYLGVTANRCAKLFRRVHTIELSETLYLRAKDVLANQENVEIYLGDGRHWIERILQSSEASDVLVFLDGHFSGGITARGNVPEPALEEIAILSRFQSKIAAIVIDDFRNFGVEQGTPSKSALLASLERYFPERQYQICVHLDQCIVTRRLVTAQAA